MTNDDWKYVEEELSSIFGRVDLIIDNYNVTIACRLEKTRHYALMVYIDGKFELKWAAEDCDIRRRFCSRHTKCYLDQKQRNRLKRERKAFREEVKKRMTFEYFLPYWNSFRMMKAHFIKNNTSIELVRKEAQNDTLG